MRSIIPTEYIQQALQGLNLTGVKWILLRNSYDELPNNLDYKKDIDILVKPESEVLMHIKMQQHRFEEIEHPRKKDRRLYGVNEFRFYKSPNNVLIDINYQFAVQSLDKGQWIPLDQAIQQSIWSNCQQVVIGNVPILMPSNEDLFITTISRCVFDKKSFSNWHKNQLTKLAKKSNMLLLMARLQLVFFKFTDTLMQLVMNEAYDDIVSLYTTFSDY